MGGVLSRSLLVLTVLTASGAVAPTAAGEEPADAGTSASDETAESTIAAEPAPPDVSGTSPSATSPSAMQSEVGPADSGEVVPMAPAPWSFPTATTWPYSTEAPQGSTPCGEPEEERFSVPLMVMGIVLSGLGGLGALGGLTAYAQVSCDETESAECSHPHESVAAALLVAGAGLAVVGVPLAIIGGIKVPVEPAPSCYIVAGPGSLGLRAAF